MTTPQDSIVVDSCQYTPVYLIQNPGAIQGRSFVITQNHVEEPKPVSDNLKRFYESSGLLENNLVNNVSNVTKPRVLKKAETKVVGNNLKLANFLVPKVENTQKQYIAVNNVVLKNASVPAPPPQVPATVSVVNGTLPRVEVDRKIVQMKIPTNVKLPTKVKPAPERILQFFPERIVQTAANERTLPKNRPKEITTSPKQTKHTSVQLLKLGETYHSINRLNEDQMKVVNQALKIFNNPTAHMQPTYDPVTNTRFIYKVVSPRDLTVVGNKNKQIIKNNKKEKKEEEKKEKEEKRDKEEKKDREDCIAEEEMEALHDEVKVTRSGRKVKFPRQIVPEDTQQKPRKKRGNLISCFQCSAEFTSLYRLQKHYECQPTHIPAKIHSNLFHCLLAIIKGSSEEDQANIFIQQLEQLIEKLKSLLPCLLKKIDGSEGNSCNINDDIARLFGMNPGKYNLNMDALACVKDIDGYCRHNPAPKPIVPDMSKPQLWLNNEDKATNDNENQDCARINAVDKWPTANKRLWKIKKKYSENAKRMRLASDNTENAVIDLDVDDLISFVDKNDVNDLKNDTTDLSAMNINEPVQINGPVQSMPIIPTDVIDYMEEQPNGINQDDIKQTKIPHMQFHSTHFDIRSSPIKPSAAVFCKFQIDSEKIARYEAQAIRPLDLDKEPAKVAEDVPIQNNHTQSESIEHIQTDHLHTDTIQSDVDSVDLQSILRDEIINLSCKDANVSDDLSFDATKDFFMNTDSNKSDDSFMKSNGLIEPSLIHVKDTVDKLPVSNDLNHDLDNDSDTQLLNQGHSVLNFLESLSNDCLSYPETDIRNTNIDFQLDLFSFHNS
ncbi:uncharacterized protein LOC128669656 [Plodia interpunctella]|uniref:uncharacterized protein LOC128669656 n=1 Tax=Plodia interpunctella TaxID=58824 RepID=UPI0023681E33|nr:uncharacterized protein LOC128669656 [Plodia interpunctella]